MEPIELLSAAQSSAQAVVDQVQPEHHSLACPCEGWDVAKLLDKMVTSGALFAVLCREEKPGPELNLLFPTEIGRSDPSASFSAAAKDCLDAFTASKLEGEMMGPLGVMVPKRAGLMVRSMDCTLNTWDLATAIGVEPEVDPKTLQPLIDFAGPFLAKVRERDDHVRFGQPQAASGGGALSELVALSGRDPSWSGG